MKRQLSRSSRLTAYSRARRGFRGLRVGLLLLPPALLLALAGAAERDARWARRIELKGAANLFQVSPDLYRAAQITDEAIPNLAKEPFSIKTVVSLRAHHDDARTLSPGLLSRYGIHVDRIPEAALHPEEEDMVAFLGVVRTAPKPILVHCRRGADRTGLMCAVYRVVIEGWSKRDALAEMLGGDYGASGLFAPAERRLLESLDVAAVKRTVGLP